MSEFVHAHRIDADAVIREYSRNGYTLVERTEPTIIAQAGFERLEFISTEEWDRQQRLKQRHGLKAVWARLVQCINLIW